MFFYTDLPPIPPKKRLSKQLSNPLIAEHRSDASSGIISLLSRPSICLPFLYAVGEDGICCYVQIG